MAKKKLNPLAIFLGSVLLIYTLLLFFFVFYDLYNSLKSGYEFSRDAVSMPKQFIGGPDRVFISSGLYNYVEAFQGISLKVDKYGTGTSDIPVYLPEMFGNSLLYAVGSAFTATLVPCLVAYVTAKYRFRFNSVIYGTVIFAMVTPIVGSAPSQIYVMDEIFGLYDTIPGMWFMTANYLGTYYLVFYGIFKGLSWEYAEAAFIDGASHFNVMLRVMFPLIRTTFGVVFLLNFISIWNNYQTPWMFMPNHPVAAAGVQFFTTAGDNKYKAHLPIQLAGSVLLMTPSLILFLIFRNKLAGNLTVGGIKG